MAFLYGDPAAAQRNLPVTAPPSQLTTPPSSIEPATVPPFDPFVGQLAPPGAWQSLSVPFASWGSGTYWDPQTLGGTTIEPYRQSFVQKVSVAGGWIAKDSSAGLGNTYFVTSATLTAPLGSSSNVLLMTPTFRMDWLDGPAVVDVPPRLYSQFVDLGWRWKVNAQLSTILGIRPGIFSDYQTSRQAFRVSGLAAISWEARPQTLTFLAGLAYVDRNDFSWLPAVGVNWKPTPDHRLDLVFPRPKIAYRVGHIPYFCEDWIYVAGFFGGNTWAVERTSGLQDELTLFDYRFSLGIERLVHGGTGWNVELGYVFGRRLDYESSGLRLNFKDSVVLEAGLSF